MRGKYVERRFGWDCHGLPIENIIEKEEGIKSKRDIEALGVGKFNSMCREAVQRFTSDWRTAGELYFSRPELRRSHGRQTVGSTGKNTHSLARVATADVSHSGPREV